MWTATSCVRRSACRIRPERWVDLLHSDTSYPRGSVVLEGGVALEPRRLPWLNGARMPDLHRSMSPRTQSRWLAETSPDVVSLQELKTDDSKFPAAAILRGTCYDLRLRGTFAPALRASERPIAIACLRLVTFFPDFP